MEEIPGMQKRIKENATTRKERCMASLLVYGAWSGLQVRRFFEEQSFRRNGLQKLPSFKTPCRIMAMFNFVQVKKIGPIRPVGPIRPIKNQSFRKKADWPAIPPRSPWPRR
jgi:hypothetical protein